MPRPGEEVGAGVSSDPLTFRVADPEGRYTAVRLCSDLHLSDRERSFARDGAEWVLEIDAPSIARLEYHLEVTDADGVSETGPDPGTHFARRARSARSRSC